MLLADELIEFHPVIGKRFRPGIRRVLTHTEWGEYVLQTNNFGFRCNHDFSSSKITGIKRILIFGDSFAFGNGVPNEVRFPDVMETLIPDIEIYNFAMEGFGLDQQYLCYQEIGAAFEHDLIIIAPAIDAIRKLTAHYEQVLDEHNVKRCYAKPYFDLVDGSLTRRNIPLPGGYIDIEDLPSSEKVKVNRGTPFAKVGDMLNKVHLKDTVVGALQYQPFPEYDNATTPGWQIMDAILTEWTSHNPKPVLVMPLSGYIYVKGKVSAKNYQARFQETADRIGYSLYDPLPELLSIPIEQRRKLFFLEGHLTPQGHAYMAKIVAPRVQDILQNL
ncbi:MAG: hypothetical protein Q7T89_16940 [Anaerolineales bacterium]|nr:hypothetical protein [Anaerolineales bacterium]